MYVKVGKWPCLKVCPRKAVSRLPFWNIKVRSFQGPSTYSKGFQGTDFGGNLDFTPCPPERWAASISKLPTAETSNLSDKFMALSSTQGISTRIRRAVPIHFLLIYYATDNNNKNLDPAMGWSMQIYHSGDELIKSSINNWWIDTNWWLVHNWNCEYYFNGDDDDAADWWWRRRLMMMTTADAMMMMMMMMMMPMRLWWWRFSLSTSS